MEALYEQVTRSQLLPAVAASFPEQTRITAERLHFSHDNPLVVGMPGLMSQLFSLGARTPAATMLSSLREFITQPSEFRGSTNFHRSDVFLRHRGSTGICVTQDLIKSVQLIPA